MYCTMCHSEDSLIKQKRVSSDKVEMWRQFDPSTEWLRTILYELFIGYVGKLWRKVKCFLIEFQFWPSLNKFPNQWNVKFSCDLTTKSRKTDIFQEIFQYLFSERNWKVSIFYVRSGEYFQKESKETYEKEPEWRMREASLCWFWKAESDSGARGRWHSKEINCFVWISIWTGRSDSDWTVKVKCSIEGPRWMTWVNVQLCMITFFNWLSSEKSTSGAILHWFR